MTSLVTASPNSFPRIYADSHGFGSVVVVSNGFGSGSKKEAGFLPLKGFRMTSLIGTVITHAARGAAAP